MAEPDDTTDPAVESSDDGPASTTTVPWPSWVPRAIIMFWLAYGVFWYGRGVLSSLRPLFIIIMISLFLSFAIEPGVNRLERLGIRRGIGTGIVFLAVVGAISGFSFAIGTVLADQIVEFVDDFDDNSASLENWLQSNISEDITLDEVEADFLGEGGLGERLTQFGDDIARFGTTVIGVLFQAFTVALFTFYMVAEGPKLRRTICGFLPPDRQRKVLQVWDLAIEKTGGYILSRSILAILSAGFHWLVFAIIGVPFPLPMALWVGVVSQFIPVIGTYIAGALPVLVGLIEEPRIGLWALVAVVVYQQIENYLFAPRVTAHTMEIHVAVAFGAVIAGAAILGIVGALLALPAAATIQAIISTDVSHHDVIEDALEPKPARRLRRRQRR